ncbi:hypothetical protein [Paenibacillus mucilaginosus]|uniref:hypothetical protein n=1 Tax=Paenibacillus mucilaginosus TaxID=61624 RepID=UPI003D2035C0
MEIKDDGSYGIYYTDAIGDNKLWHLGNDLLQFLDALVTCYGAPYWKWSKQTEVYIEKINVD